MVVCGVVWHVVWYGGMVVWHVVWYGVAWCGMVWFGMVLVVLCFMENRGLSESGPDESSGQNFWGKMHGIAVRVWWDGWFVVWCGIWWYGVVYFGVVWYRVVWYCLFLMAH